MIIANGLLAQAFGQHFASDSDIKIFAAGVSNSRETRSFEFLRERRMLEACLSRHARTVYFSTCSIYDTSVNSSPYVRHKLAMEAMVLKSDENVVFRLPQAVGRASNKSTLCNFLYDKLINGEEIELWIHARRNLIDVADIFRIGKVLIERGDAAGAITNIAAPVSHSMLEILRTFEKVLAMRARYKKVNAGSAYQIDTKVSDKIARLAGIEFNSSYLERVIRKYYAE